MILTELIIHTTYYTYIYKNISGWIILIGIVIFKRNRAFTNISVKILYIYILIGIRTKIRFN